MTIRVGVIGAGQAGERHAIGFAADARAQVVAVADVSRDRARGLAERFDATAYDDWKAVFDHGVDVVAIALPHSMHVAPAREAAGHGVHVLMEKPIATSLEDARTVVDACGSAGVTLAVGFVHRFREEVIRAKAWLAEAGAPQIARESMSSQRTPSHPGWITKRDVAGGGVLMYGAIHGVDRLRWFLQSDAVRVDARTRTYTEDTEVEDGIAALIEYENGAVATLTASAPLYPAQPAPWETEVYARDALVRVRTRQWAEVSREGRAVRFDADAELSTHPPHYNFARQATDVVEAVTEGRSPLIGAVDGLRALETCLALYRSADERRPVSLEEIRTEDIR